MVDVQERRKQMEEEEAQKLAADAARQALPLQLCLASIVSVVWLQLWLSALGLLTELTPVADST